MTTTMIPTGGYALAKYRDAGGEETIRFQAELHLNGKRVAIVSNDGRGGSHNIRFADQSQRAAFHAFVGEARTEEWEPEGAFIDDLTSLVSLARKRSVAFVLDGDDFFATGEYRAFPATVPLDAALDMLRTAEYASLHPLYFDKRSMSFVPVPAL